MDNSSFLARVQALIKIAEYCNHCHHDMKFDAHNVPKILKAKSKVDQALIELLSSERFDEFVDEVKDMKTDREADDYLKQFIDRDVAEIT